VDGAISQYKLDSTNTAAVTMTDLVPVYIKTAPACPAGGTYTIAADSPTNAVSCSLATQADYPHVL